MSAPPRPDPATYWWFSRDPWSERADAAERAAALIGGSPPGDAARFVAIVYPGFEQRAQLMHDAKTLNQPWMADVVARLRGDSTLVAAASTAKVGGKNAADSTPFLVVARTDVGRPVAVAASGNVQGHDRLLLFSIADPGSLASAALIVAVTRALSSAPPVTELEPASVSDAVLQGWERPASPIAPLAVYEAAVSDGRWFWVIAIALLLIETLIRRRSRRLDGALDLVAELTGLEIRPSLFLARASRRLALLTIAEGAAAGLGAAVVVAAVGWSGHASIAWTAIAGVSLIAAGILMRMAVSGGSTDGTVAAAAAIEARAPECRNLLVTAAELIDHPTRVRPYVGELVSREAARLMNGLALERLFPSRRSIAALAAGGVLWVVLLGAVAARPPGVDGVVASGAPPAAISGVDVDGHPPAYTGQGRQSSHDPARIEALAGSRIHLTGKSVRGAAAVAMETIEEVKSAGVPESLRLSSS